ncbi:MAG: mechanosensitive ion channel domain-containing protein [Pseudomonadota bacterium]
MDFTEQYQRAFAFAEPGIELLRNWATSPAAWSQFALLLIAFFAAWFVNRKLSRSLRNLLTPKDDNTTLFANARRFLLIFLPLMMPLLAYAFTAAGEQVTASLFGSSSVIALGKRVFLFLAARALANHVITDPFLKILARYVLVPIAGFYVLGLLDTVSTFLSEFVINLGNISFSLMSLVRGVIAGSILFWLGRWSNDQSTTLLKRQEDLRPATRQLAIKAAEIAIFGTAFLLLMSIMGINLSALAVLGGAIGVGLGFGLQKIASNFISGVILLLEGQATVGDFVELDGGEAGTIVKMTARAIILETFDGRWIVVPNEDFIVTRVTNYSDQGSANRYEAEFSVSYDTDINLVPDIVEAAVQAHPDVLEKPYPADCELRGFGDSGVDFAVEFWVNGIDDGQHKYTSQVLFLIWNALKEAQIEIPFPHRVIEIKGDRPA